MYQLLLTSSFVYFFPYEPPKKEEKKKKGSSQVYIKIKLTGNLFGVADFFFLRFDEYLE